MYSYNQVLTSRLNNVWADAKIFAKSSLHANPTALKLANSSLFTNTYAKIVQL